MHIIIKTASENKPNQRRKQQGGHTVNGYNVNRDERGREEQIMVLETPLMREG